MGKSDFEICVFNCR